MEIMIGLACIIVFGLLAQWLAWCWKIPSILLLLLFGILAGPVSQALGYPTLDPEALFGSGLLQAIVSLSVAVILFEGGLTLRVSELKETGSVVWKLITIGAAATWLLAAYFAHLCLGLSWQLSLLLGAVLIVSGPTVIGPLLIQVKPNTRMRSILKWEGILIDPIGALASVLMYEIILESGHGSPSVFITIAVVKTLVIGTVLGVAGAWLMMLLYRRYWVPDHLQNPFSLAIVALVFVVSNVLMEESGLLTVTVMGIFLANQKQISVSHLLAFKEDLRVLLISALFIILVARLEWVHIQNMNGQAVLFLVLLILVVRPAGVLLSTIGSHIPWNERLFLSWVAPRGIVAAAISSVFALNLVAHGYEEAEMIIAATFFVIIGTVLIYGFTASIVAKFLHVSEANAKGILILGANPWVQDLAKMLNKMKFPVIMVDTNRSHIQKARLDGIRAVHRNLFSEFEFLGGIHKVFAMTPNDELNSLGCIHFMEWFERKEIFQLPPEKEPDSHQPGRLNGRYLFRQNATFDEISHKFFLGNKLKKTKLTEEFGYPEFQEYYENKAMPMFLINENKELAVFSPDQELIPKPGQTLISLVPVITEKA